MEFGFPSALIFGENHTHDSKDINFIFFIVIFNVLNFFYLSSCTIILKLS
jgi:hypothetical protein